MSGIQESFQVYHNFCLVLDDVRNSALESGFGTWKPTKGEVGSSVYTGMNYTLRHDLMLFSLYQKLRVPIFPQSMFSRVSNIGAEKAYVHSDRESGAFTCIAYMSEHKGDHASGTGFYRHRETGLTSMPSFEELRKKPKFFEQLKKEMVEGSDDVWELTDFVRGDCNKAVVFNAPMFHSRHPKEGFGITEEDGRMIWGCHFRLLAQDGLLTP